MRIRYTTIALFCVLLASCGGAKDTENTDTGTPDVDTTDLGTDPGGTSDGTDGTDSTETASSDPGSTDTEPDTGVDVPTPDPMISLCVADTIDGQDCLAAPEVTFGTLLPGAGGLRFVRLESDVTIGLAYANTELGEFGVRVVSMDEIDAVQEVTLPIDVEPGELVWIEISVGTDLVSGTSLLDNLQVGGLHHGEHDWDATLPLTATIDCSEGLADCDGDVSNGCETDLLTDTNNCGGCGAICSDEEGFPECVDGSCNTLCQPGFTGLDCHDIDECVDDTHECQPWITTCVNTEGSYECACEEGFDGDGQICEDKDECALGLHNCAEMAWCENNYGGFVCTCLPGFTGSGYVCNDFNECNLGPCDDGYICENLSGSFQCNEVDECVLGNNACLPEANCINTPGSYECECPSGYQGDAIMACEDINECIFGLDNCHADAHCTNNSGSFYCSCNGGYAGNGIYCQNLDECASGSHQCCGDAVCIDNIGGYDCECKDGFDGNGYFCTDIDECDLETDSCDPNALCTNLVPGFSCTCNEGYEGNGETCTLVP